jgi:carbonic anhydrase/acetyltransferase-like protein (isoleucine patch superfamily)
MLKIILQALRPIPPFNEPARDLRIQNVPLWLWQRDILAPYVNKELEIASQEHLPQLHDEMLVYRDNLFFDEFYMREFIRLARQRKRPSRAAFSIDDLAFREHALPLSSSYTQSGSLYLVDMWYYPNGPEADADPLVIDMQAREIGYYHVPSYMAGQRGDLVYQVPMRALMAIDCWTHVFIADGVFGLFARGARFEERLKSDLPFKLGLIATALYEGRQLLECSRLVQIGKNCVIDPHAVIHGPTTIGDNVTIGAGAVIENCIIGSNVNISQGVQLMLSVVGDGTFLPFRAAMFMTTIMENSMIAQNTCLQMCVVGRNTFIGAGSTFTDYNLLPATIKAMDGYDELKSSKVVTMSTTIHSLTSSAASIVFFF